MLIFFYLIIYFFIYSILGWICEMIFCYVTNNQKENRGFLFGPYCPIYGFGGLIIAYALIPFRDNIFLIFIFSIIISSILEYITAYSLEKIFNKKWWDYSNRRFNINGRVCLGNSLLFGILGVITIYIIHPIIVDLITSIPTYFAPITAIIILLMLITDLYFTTRNLIFDKAYK